MQADEKLLADKSLLTIKDIVEFADILDVNDVKEVFERQIAYNTSIAEEGLKNSWGVKDYMIGMKNYTARQVLEIIGYIREYDAKSKGVENSGNTTDGLLRELLFKILH